MANDIERMLYRKEFSGLAVEPEGKRETPVVDFTRDVALVLRSRWGITDSHSGKPIIATYLSIGDVGLLGYDRKHELGFLMNIQPSNSVRKGLQRLCLGLVEAGGRRMTREFDTKIVVPAGYNVQTYEELDKLLGGNFEYLGSHLRTPELIKLTPGEERGVALDTRNGEIALCSRDAIRTDVYDSDYNYRIPYTF